eukprot:768254-Hanusia_phi.AAC.4
MEQWQFKLACLAAAVIQVLQSCTRRGKLKLDRAEPLERKEGQEAELPVQGDAEEGETTRARGEFIKWAEDEEVEVDRYVIKRTSTSKNNAVGDGGKSAEMIAARFDTLEQKVKDCWWSTNTCTPDNLSQVDDVSRRAAELCQRAEGGVSQRGEVTQALALAGDEALFSLYAFCSLLSLFLLQILQMSSALQGVQNTSNHAEGPEVRSGTL